MAKRYPDSKAELDAWFHEAEAAVWANPAQIKQQYGNASILKESRAVFNICGKNFVLWSRLTILTRFVYVRFAGTHREYDGINAMKPKVIKTESDCAAVLARIEALMDAERNTPRGDELELLSLLVHDYEEKTLPIAGAILPSK